jgi:signal transduction histidine kinase
MRIARVYALAAAVGFPICAGAFLLTLERTRATAELIDATEGAELLSREAIGLADVAHRLVNETDPERRLLMAAQLVGRSKALAKAATLSPDRLAVGRFLAIANRLAADLDALIASRSPAADRLCDGCALLGRIASLMESVHAVTRPIFAEARERVVQVRATVLMAGATLALVMSALWLYVHLAVIRPLERLSGALRRAGEGDLTLRIDERARNEVGDIARAFNRMAGNLSRLTASRAELEAEIAQRKALETDLLERNAHLLEANAELDKFAYIASHDLRAPLRAIRNIAAWIEEDARDDLPAEAARLFSLMRSRVARLDALLDALLEYTRIGRVVPPIEIVDLRSLVAETAPLCDPAGAFAIAYDGPDVTLAAHRGALELVLRHLVGNAVKHHDRGTGRVTVTAAVEEDRCRIRVVDDGPGVPEGMQERVFEMFQTLRPRDEVEGSGMGLALARKTARVYGSEVTLESPVADGRGSAFAVLWPLRAAADRRGGETAESRGGDVAG